MLKAKPKKDSKRPENEFDVVLWKKAEYCAGGTLDLKNNGMEQTNGKSLTSLQNCRKVFDTLLGMYATGHKNEQWLQVQIIKWKALADALFDVGSFLKS